MRTVKYCLLAALSLGLVGVGVNGADDAPKNSIKDVMKKGHSAPKGQEKLCSQVVGGKATDEQKKELLALYIDLPSPQVEPDTARERRVAGEAG